MLVQSDQLNDTIAQNSALENALTKAKEYKYQKLLFKTYNWFVIAHYKRGNYEISDAYTDSMALLADSLKIPELRPLKNIELANKRNIKRTDSAIHYYQLAIKDSALLNHEALTKLLFNLSNALNDKGFYKEALPYVNQAVNILETQEVKTDSEWTTLLNGKSLLFWIHLNLKDTSSAFYNLKSSLEILDRQRVKPKPEIYADLGSYYLFRNQPDSALHYFQILENQTNNVESKSMRVRPYLSKAKAYLQKGAYATANAYLIKVETTLQLEDTTSNRKVRDYIKWEYYNLKYEIEKATGNTSQALLALEHLKLLDDKKSEAQQSYRVAELERVLTEARAEKTISANELELKEQRRYILYLIITTLSFLLIAYLIVREQRRKRLFSHQEAIQLQQKMELEKSRARLQAESEERKRIAKEIHDDISPTITTLSIAAQTIGLIGEKEVLAKTTKTIVRMTKQINEQISEIIWSLDSSADELLHLNAYIRKFANGFLNDVGIKLEFSSNITTDESKIAGYKRRAIYHTVKEVLNNAVKYSGSNTIELSILKEQETLSISIKDFGVGLNTHREEKGTGYGLKNIEKNIKNLGGQIRTNNANGLTTILLIPLDTMI